MPTPDELAAAIEMHLKETGLAASRFGVEAVGDPGFVSDRRAGREPRSRTVKRVLAFIEARKAAVQPQDAAQ